jgi:hypothetical protein
MNGRRPIVFATAVLTCWLLGCSSDEGAPKPVPVDSGTTPAADSTTKGEGGSGRSSPEGGDH